MSNAADYGGDGLLDPEKIATIIETLESHTDRLDGHYALQLHAWDDGDVMAELKHTVKTVPGAGPVPPRTIAQALVYVVEDDTIEYQDWMNAAGERNVHHSEVIETDVLADE